MRSQVFKAIANRFGFALIAALGGVSLLGDGAKAQDSTSPPSAQVGFRISFTPGSRDAAGRFMGGTEIRTLVGHDGKLFAGNSYWEDRPDSEGTQGAEIFVLDGPDAQWRVDHVFEERLPDDRARHLAVGVMSELRFATNAAGAPLASPVAILLASTWDLTGELKVFTRDDATGEWVGTAVANDPRAPGVRTLPQIRSFGSHRDHITGVDLAFAGEDPRGVFSGVYDPAVPGRIRWAPEPEFDIKTIALDAFPGLAGGRRITSFAECNGSLYAAIGHQIYERTDGKEPKWRLIYSNPTPGRSETGLRGLTAIRNPSGEGDVLLAAVEGDAARIIRVDPRDGREITDFDIRQVVARAWGMRVNYMIAAYNDMAKLHDSKGRAVLVIGFESFIPPAAAVAAGHSVVDVGYGRLESGAWYLVRNPIGDYEMRQIPPRPGGQPMIAVRSVVASPFPHDEGYVYFAGFDANKAPAHNTSWIVRADLAGTVGAAP
jgi:hypothetical protein